MRVSLGWIKRILGRQDLGVSVADLQAKLTLHVAEFEADVERSGPNLDGVVVGKVLTCVQHPGADRLRCTTVDIGTGVLKVGRSSFTLAQGLFNDGRLVATTEATIVMVDKETRRPTPLPSQTLDILQGLMLADDAQT